ncbi:MAG: hypothetical protein M3O92_01045 [Actinomycetota bacterium]|nr:hypothetical protein [Actinomycetota bacterium]
MKGRIALSACAAIAALVVTPALGTPGLPLGIAALGGADSTGGNSWSTGTNRAVRSHLNRLQQMTGSVREVRASTFATSGFRTVADLAPQVRKTIASNLRYVTIDVGVGDVCSGTSPLTFRNRLVDALRSLSRHSVVQQQNRSPDQREIFVVSIENLVGHWHALGGKNDLGCGLHSSARRALIQRRTIAFNDILARVCYRTTECLFDAGARYSMRLHPSYFSARGLTVAGERAVAAVEWKPAKVLLDAGS